MDIFCITSVAVQVTIVSPSGNTSGALFSKEITPTASETRGISSGIRFCVSDLASNVISGNCSISAGVVSFTVIVWGDMAIFPEPSIDVQMIVVIPNGNNSGALFDKDNIPLSSVASAWPILTNVNPLVASMIRSSGTNMTGFLKSFGIGFTGSNSIFTSLISSNSCRDSDSSAWICMASCSFNSASIINFSDAIGVENFWIWCAKLSTT